MVPLGLTAPASATDTAIQKQIFGLGTTTLIILNEKIDIMKIVKSLEDSGLLIKGRNETNQKMKQKNKRGDLLACY